MGDKNEKKEEGILETQYRTGICHALADWTVGI